MHNLVVLPTEPLFLWIQTLHPDTHPENVCVSKSIAHIFSSLHYVRIFQNNFFNGGQIWSCVSSEKSQGQTRLNYERWSRGRADDETPLWFVLTGRIYNIQTKDPYLVNTTDKDVKQSPCKDVCILEQNVKDAACSTSVFICLSISTQFLSLESMVVVFRFA